MTTTRTESLKILEIESDAQFEHLRKKRADGGLLYVPDPSALHVWELKTDERHDGYGYSNRHSYTGLYLTRDLAVRAACEIIKARYMDDRHEFMWNEQLVALLKAEKHEAAIEYVEQHYSTPHFEIRSVEVHAKAEMYQISDPKNDKT